MKLETSVRDRLRPEARGRRGNEEIDPDLLSLADAIGTAKRGDPLAPVTVVVSSSFSALSAKCQIGSRRCLANVTFATVDELIASVGGPALCAKGLRVATRAVELEAIRRELQQREPASRAGGSPRRLEAFRRTFAYLRRLEHEGLDLRPISASGAGRAELIRLFGRVRDKLAGSGFADALDLEDEAVSVLRGHGLDRSGTVITFELGPTSPFKSKFLRALRSTCPFVTVEPHRRRAPREISACSDPAAEARAAVRNVLLALEGGVPLWRQAVLHPDGGTPRYDRVLRQQLEEAALAHCGPAWRKLDSCAAGRALLGLLALPESQWQRDRLVRWLSSSPIVRPMTGLGVPAAEWDTVSTEAGVVRGASEWEERLRHLAAREPRMSDTAEEMRAFVADLIERTRSLRAGRTLSSWAARSKSAVELLDTYLPPAGFDQLPGDELAGVEQVRSALSQLAELDRISGAVDSSGFERAVRAELEGTRWARAGPPSVCDGVFVGPISSARGMRFGSVVITGLADAVVPGGAPEDPLLPDELLRRVGLAALGGREHRIMQLESDLDAALRSASAGAVATFPRVDPRTGRAQFECRWLSERSDSNTRRNTEPSFAVTLLSHGPATSASDLGLRDLASSSAAGDDPLGSPVVTSDARLTRGFELCMSRSDASFSRFDGYVGEGLVSVFDPLRPVSATRLETYANCPRKFLLARELGVERRKRPEDLLQIEATERGTLVHAVLEQYVVERLRGEQRSLGRLLEIAEANFSDAESRGIVGRPLLWRIEKANLKRDLIRFYEEEGDLIPIAAELEFEEAAVTLEDGRTVTFRGRADRVDKTPEGTLVVSDYKTGRQSQLRGLMNDPVAKGVRLQLPLYAMAARESFGETGSQEVHARYWLISGERSASCYSVLVTSAIEHRFREVLGLIADGIEAGAFPAVPGERIPGGFLKCAWCEFDSICPPTRDKQWSTKREGSSLKPVLELMSGDVPAHLVNAVQRGVVWATAQRAGGDEDRAE